MSENRVRRRIDAGPVGTTSAPRSFDAASANRVRQDRNLRSSGEPSKGQNVYLFCASEGLASVFRGAVDYAKLARLMRLPEQQFVTFAQTVGYPYG